MIKINLLPQLTKIKKTSQVPPFFYLAVILVGIVVFAVYTFQSSRINSMKNKIRVLQDKQKELKPRVEAVEAQLNELEQKNQAINELSGQERLLWSKKLNDLSDLTPDRVRFDHIIIETRDTKRYLKFDGMAYSASGEERLSLMARLMEALKSKSFYYKPNGEPNFGEIEFVQANAPGEKVGGWNVVNFTIQMEIL